MQKKCYADLSQSKIHANWYRFYSEDLLQKNIADPTPVNVPFIAMLPAEGGRWKDEKIEL